MRLHFTHTALTHISKKKKNTKKETDPISSNSSSSAKADKHSVNIEKEVSVKQYKGIYC